MGILTILQLEVNAQDYNREYADSYYPAAGSQEAKDSKNLKPIYKWQNADFRKTRARPPASNSNVRQSSQSAQPATQSDQNTRKENANSRHFSKWFGGGRRSVVRG